VTEPYGEAFFADQAEGSLRSARVIAPLVVDLVHPTSIVDVGCGIGTWLSAFRESGVRQVQGFDGAYVDRTKLLIPAESFTAVDLRTPEALTGTYDLALCLEVAEHLPTAVSGRLVAALTGLAPVVLFSAAIPAQEGTAHLNEQWPAFWIAHFERLGFRAVDALRPVIRDDARVDWWYRQNILLFANDAALVASSRLAAAARAHPSGALEWVHAEVLHRYDNTRWVAGVLWRRVLRKFFGGRVS
jgi:SAM-dependent methyltransferase